MGKGMNDYCTKSTILCIIKMHQLIIRKPFFLLEQCCSPENQFTKLCTSLFILFCRNLGFVLLLQCTKRNFRYYERDGK
jgi:hypothetical protein